MDNNVISRFSTMACVSSFLSGALRIGSTVGYNCIQGLVAKSLDKNRFGIGF